MSILPQQLDQLMTRDDEFLGSGMFRLSDTVRIKHNVVYHRVDHITERIIR